MISASANWNGANEKDSPWMFRSIIIRLENKFITGFQHDGRGTRFHAVDRIPRLAIRGLAFVAFTAVDGSRITYTLTVECKLNICPAIVEVSI